MPLQAVTALHRVQAVSSPQLLQLFGPSVLQVWKVKPVLPVPQCRHPHWAVPSLLVLLYCA